MTEVEPLVWRRYFTFRRPPDFRAFLSCQNSMALKSAYAAITVGVAQGETKCAKDPQAMPINTTPNGAEKPRAPERRMNARNTAKEPKVPATKWKRTVPICLFACDGGWN